MLVRRGYVLLSIKTLRVYSLHSRIQICTRREREGARRIQKDPLLLQELSPHDSGFQHCFLRTRSRKTYGSHSVPVPDRSLINPHNSEDSVRFSTSKSESRHNGWELKICTLTLLRIYSYAVFSGAPINWCSDQTVNIQALLLHFHKLYSFGKEELSQTTSFMPHRPPWQTS